MLSTATRVNDIHSQLNETDVAVVVSVDSLEAVCRAVARARDQGLPMAVSGGRHAMGGQQFCAGGLLLDTRSLDRILAFDRERGVVEVEAGIQWPALLRFLDEVQTRDGRTWGIRQKQTGADRLTIGGALSANIHGRGLTMKPIVADVESFVLVDALGEVRVCSRDENAELFRLAIGGYGLFGIIYSVRLRLAPRTKVERVVELRDVDGLIEAFESRAAEGFLYGDFQFAIDPSGPEFLRRGVFSCYRPVDDATPIPQHQHTLTAAQWRELLYLAHFDKSLAWHRYSEHYLATDGQVYRSDSHQLAEYVDDYHIGFEELGAAGAASTEMITEIFVPRNDLAPFLAEVADDFRRTGVDLVYGTVRLVDQDDETFLPWARRRWACVIFNLHVVHDAAGIDHATRAFQRLIDLAIAHNGSYYLTYHRWALPAQLEVCYPDFREFLRQKRRFDPELTFQSDWYRHYAAALAARQSAVVQPQRTLIGGASSMTVCSPCSSRSR